MLIGYVTVDEADEYVWSHLVSTRTERISWEALSEEDKAIYLLESVESMDQLIFPGRKTSTSQPYAFPRWPQVEVPENIKHAQIENALALCDKTIQEEAQTYQAMRSYGVKSYSIGDLSESLDTTSQSVLFTSTGICSLKARALLKPYMGGAYRI